ncbi:hypothetical protein Pla144_34940 [Bythopirellula polymerisocia]|uniref:Uncharacterized protein n=1 Tax=Bythopirellula polymerisocia TaxID=2528003 RepID=A0A5C6CPD9_9BACT|nr:hypothetical protein Pla144_34940 [Bythopirellula polymerisocia]
MPPNEETFDINSFPATTIVRQVLSGYTTNVMGIPTQVIKETTTGRLSAVSPHVFGASATALQEVDQTHSISVGSSGSPASAAAQMQYLDEVTATYQDGEPWTGQLLMFWHLEGELFIESTTPLGGRISDQYAGVSIYSETDGIPEQQYLSEAAFYSSFTGNGRPGRRIDQVLAVPLNIDSGYGYLQLSLVTLAQSHLGYAASLFSDTMSVTSIQLANGDSLASIGLDLQFASDNAVPEPSAISLGLAPAIALVLQRRRRQ